MKKQVISFLALFGLVFVLSIYYVLLPTNLFIKAESPVNGSQSNIVGNISFTIDETNNLYFASLEDKLEQKHDNIILEYESIIASSSYENEQKEVAYNMLNNQLLIMENEELLVSKIIESGYYNAYVEYQYNIIKVIVQTNSLTNEQAAQLISLVMDNSINGLLPEISYVN